MRTAKCSTFGQKEIVANFDSESGLDPSWLVNFFESAAEQGKRFLPNETVQIGWMVVLLKETTTNELEIWEPQFDSIPIKWTLGINNTLRHLVLQKSIANLFNVEPDFPSLAQAGLVTNLFLEKKDISAFTMNRKSGNGNYSGWHFKCISENIESNANELRSLFEISFYQIKIIPFLALPNGSEINIDGKRIAVRLNGKFINSENCDLLESLSKSNTLV